MIQTQQQQQKQKQYGNKVWFGFASVASYNAPSARGIALDAAAAAAVVPGDDGRWELRDCGSLMMFERKRFRNVCLLLVVACPGDGEED